MDRTTKSRAATLPAAGEAANRYRRVFRGNPFTRTESNTRSATLKQVSDACKEKKQGGRLVLSNSQLYTVRICGRLVSIDQEDGHTKFRIDDGTASVLADIRSYWDDGHTDLTGSVLGAYYMVIANVTTYNGELELQALKAWKVINHNDVTMHFLSAIHEHCDLSLLKKPDLEHWEKAKEEASNYTRTKLNDELNKEAVVAILTSEKVRGMPDGANIGYILRMLHMDEAEGRHTLSCMLDEGSIYNTIDYNHYKMAD